MKFIKRLLLFILIVIIAISSFVIYQGYLMYKSAVSNISLSQKISEIEKKKSSSFVGVENMWREFRSGRPWIQTEK